jgi:hypothetical protein
VKKSKNVENISIKYVQKSPKKLAALHFMPTIYFFEFFYCNSFKIFFSVKTRSLAALRGANIDVDLRQKVQKCQKHTKF